MRIEVGRTETPVRDLVHVETSCLIAGKVGHYVKLEPSSLLLIGQNVQFITLVVSHSQNTTWYSPDEVSSKEGYLINNYQ